VIRKEARFDFDRINRIGMVEAVWGEHKTADQIINILRTIEKSREIALVTRVSALKAKKIIDVFPYAEFHSSAGCLTLGPPAGLKPGLGNVCILSGGTSDIAVASEVELPLRWHGVRTEMLMDVGVSGLHRLLDNLDILKKSNVVIACAGMEGALPTVLAGLIPQPVIGVPVSVGYGVSQGGRTALEGMLASCAPGLVVVNIDNGYGAAMAALRILNTFEQSE
tara:strand:- start:2008 stop:2676 length:669 start_codon:yes stop_codon:yes gene_type:complete